MRFAALFTLVLLAVLAVPLRAQDIFQEGTTITIKLMNGDQITGILEHADQSKLVILHDIFGRIEVPRAAIEPTAAPMVEPVSPWSGTFDVSIDGSEGNTDENNTRVGLDFAREDTESKDAFTSWFKYSTTDNEATEEKTFAQLRHEWKLDGTKWRPFVQGQYERDIFDGWDARAGVAGGGSYQFTDGPVHKTAGRLGLGVNRKFNVDDDDVEETTYEALVGFDWAWKIDQISNFTFSTDIYPSLSETGEYRGLARVAYDRKVSPDSAWFIKLGMDDTYDSQPGDGNHAHDFNYFLGLGREF